MSSWPSASPSAASPPETIWRMPSTRMATDRWTSPSFARVSPPSPRWRPPLTFTPVGVGCFGLGVAGNVAGHMAQAGMTQDSGKTPASICLLLPPDPPDSHSDAAGQGKILDKIHTFPVTTNIVEYPRDAGASKVQVEPEMAVFVDVQYAEPGSDGKRLVTGLVPRKVAAFNDRSIRALRARTSSEKKNWGAESKGSPAGSSTSTRSRRARWWTAS